MVFAMLRFSCHFWIALTLSNKISKLLISQNLKILIFYKILFKLIHSNATNSVKQNTYD